MRGGEDRFRRTPGGQLLRLPQCRVLWGDQGVRNNMGPEPFTEVGRQEDLK